MICEFQRNNEMSKIVKGLVCGLLESKVQLDCLLLVLEVLGIHAVSGKNSFCNNDNAASSWHESKCIPKSLKTTLSNTKHALH